MAGEADALQMRFAFAGWVTRAREKLAVIVVQAPALFEKVLSILQGSPLTKAARICFSGANHIIVHTSRYTAVQPHTGKDSQQLRVLKYPSAASPSFVMKHFHTGPLPYAHSPVWSFPNGKPCPFFMLFNESE